MIRVFFFICMMAVFSGHTQELALARMDDQFGFINTAGEWHIKPQFKDAKSFSDDLAEAMNDDKSWGFINRKGEWAIQPQFKDVKAFHSGIAMATNGDDWFYIDKTGNKTLTQVQTDKYYDFSDGMAIIRTGDLVGFINTKGEVVVGPKFEKVFPFQNGYSKVLENGKWGLIDKTGAYFVKTEYDGISNVSKGPIVAEMGTSKGLIVNGQFKEIPGAEKIWDFDSSKDITFAKKGGQLGFIDAQGNWVIEPQFDKVKAFKNGLAPVMKDKKWGYIDPNGKVVIDFQYKDAEVFSDDGLAPVKSSKLWGFIDKSGSLVIDEQYDISSVNFGALFGSAEDKGFINGLSRVKLKKEWAFIKPNGEVLGNTWFENLELFK